MDTFARVIHWGMVAVVLLTASAVALACPDIVTQYGYTGVYGANAGNTFPTRAAACSAGAGTESAAMSRTVGANTFFYALAGSDNGTTCVVSGGWSCSSASGSCGTGTESHPLDITAASVTVECDSCAAQAGKQAFGGVGEAAYSGGSGSSPAFSSAVCVGGCRYNISADAPQAAEKADSGGWTSRADAKDTKGAGISCNAEPAATVPPCPRGTAPGTVTINGTTTSLCAKVDQSATKEPVTVKTADASASSPEVTTVSKETKCTGDRCTTTTTTTTTGGGGPGGSKTDTVGEGKSDFCAKNPGSKLCTKGQGEDEGTSFGGTCASTSCSGDAVVCAIAQEQAKRACELQQSIGDGTRTDPLAVAGDAALTAGDAPEAHPRNASKVGTHDLSGGFDQSRLFGGGCPSDRVLFGSVMLPLSSLCTPLTWLGNVLTGICALACVGILFKGA